jgi:hypothetical protein
MRAVDALLSVLFELKVCKPQQIDWRFETPTAKVSLYVDCMRDPLLKKTRDPLTRF